MGDAGYAALRRDHAMAYRLLEGPPGRVHLLGIGGVGMAALALHLKARGWEVDGCDAGRSRVTDWLEARGIRVAMGHDPSHVRGPGSFAVRSPAVGPEEPEVRAAAAAGLPVLVRGAVLPALLRGRRSVAVSGTHGKTTTTAMIAHALRACGVDASFCVGGEADEMGGVAAVGASDAMVVEADESDGTLALYAPDFGVITNIEMDHVDFFRSDAELDACFAAFAEQVRGRLIYCADDARASSVASRSPVAAGYGFAPSAHVQGRCLWEQGTRAGCEVWRDGARLGALDLAVPGATNVLDALAAVAVALEFGLPFDAVARALGSFRSVRRRFDVRARGRGIIVVSDYAHHPTEIRALMRQARGLGARRILAVFQPHRYTRTAALGADFPSAFEGVDALWLVPVYAASEAPVPGGRTEDLHALFRRDGRVPAEFSESLLDAWNHIRNKWREGDALLVVGAGDVEQVAAWAADVLSSPSS